MTITSTCAKCGAVLPSDAPEGLCPKCLVLAGLMSQFDKRAQETIEFSPSRDFAEAQSPAGFPTPDVPRWFGGYRIIRPLGKGGMGTVYEAEEEASGRRLALKVLAHSLDSEQARTRFFREGRLAASVNHPNSVYIFGTEEIDELPVITMELAPGGTLQDLVKRQGPLPIPQAVDTILQVIAGLEAAATGGVLHRDVKPSNCFLDPDGTVKVGDFGLSISTLARSETNITTTGTMLGTPAYASPEQLRGDELDARSDMYAVGVTLYYLMTGQTPFTAGNMVKLLATVLERPAESPRKLRPEIPVDLANVVLRSLAKQPAQRFRNYEEMRQALLPFTSSTAEPAALSTRCLAGFLDVTLASLVYMAIAAVVWPNGLRLLNNPGSQAPAGRLLSFIPLIPMLLYYALPEGLWGASLGKAICRLRVVDPRRNALSLPGAFVRAAVFVLLPEVLNQLADSWFSLKADFSLPQNIWRLLLTALAAPLSAFALLFCTIRRRNGFAGLHDLLSRTRVIVKPTWQIRTATAHTIEPAKTGEETPRIGPYHVLAELDSSNDAKLLLGYDDRLFRKVWIRQLPDGAPEVAPASRMMGRRGRLRWLGGKRAPGENWDAYEALTGQPLSERIQERQTWKRCRFWLLDLAEELDTGLKDQSLPAVLALDRVWITADGRAKLIDFAAPVGARGGDKRDSLTAAITPPAPVGERDAQLFLKRVAIAAMEGRAIDHEDLTCYAPKVPMPLHARSFITALPEFPTFDGLIAQFRGLMNRIAEISRARRLALLLGCLMPLLFFAPGVFIILFPTLPQSQARHVIAEISELNECLDRLETLKTNQDPGKESAAIRQALEIYVASRFRGMATNAAEWNAARSMIPTQRRQSVENLVAAHASDTQAQIKQATEQVKPLLAEIHRAADRRTMSGAGGVPSSAAAMGALYASFIFLLLVTGLPAMIAAAFFGGGMLLHGLGLAVVTKVGSPASRRRILWRACIVWSPVLWFVIGPILVVPALPRSMATWRAVMLAIAASLPVLFFAAAALWSLRRPERGVQDWLAGTQMVPL